MKTSRPVPIASFTSTPDRAFCSSNTLMSSLRWAWRDEIILRGEGAREKGRDRQTNKQKHTETEIKTKRKTVKQNYGKVSRETKHAETGEGWQLGEQSGPHLRVLLPVLSMRTITTDSILVRDVAIIRDMFRSTVSPLRQNSWRRKRKNHSRHVSINIQSPPTKLLKKKKKKKEEEEKTKSTQLYYMEEECAEEQLCAESPTHRSGVWTDRHCTKDFTVTALVAAQEDIRKIFPSFLTWKGSTHSQVFFFIQNKNTPI